MPVVTLASAAGKEKGRPSDRTSGGGERSPINSRWIFAADGDLQHISTQRARACAIAAYEVDDDDDVVRLPTKGVPDLITTYNCM